MKHLDATPEQIQAWIEEAIGNGCTHILSISDIRPDRPVDTPSNYPVYAYGLRDLAIVMEYYAGKQLERVMQSIKMNEDGTVNKDYLFAIIEKN